MTAADETYDFTDQEFKVIFGVLRGLTNKDIAQHYKMAEDTAKHYMLSIYDKAGVSNRLELYEFLKAAINAELRRRLEDKLKGPPQ